MTAPIRVLVADDQRVVREGLVMVLGLLDDVEVIGTASDGAEAVTMAAELRPDIVLMDLKMPRCDGVQATRTLREQQPDVKVVVLTTYADDKSVIEALRAGARGYLTKDAGSEQIREGLRQVFADGAVIDPAVQRHLLDAIGAAPAAEAAATGPASGLSSALSSGLSSGQSSGQSSGGRGGELPDGLTPREAEVLTLIATGLSNTEIAERLFVTEGTVKSHVNHLFAKIGARDRAQAVTYAYHNGLAK
jgi:DNA-binding NarL/FixJ family response regulator